MGHDLPHAVRFSVTRTVSVWRWRLTAMSCLVAFVAIVPATAYAACIVPSAPHATRLAQIAAGRSGFDVAFVGRLVRRLPAVKRKGSVFTPIDFQVIKSFDGGVAPRTRVLVRGGCVGKLCYSVEDTVNYTSGRYQLVLADRTPAGLVSATACTDAGPVSAADLSLLLRGPQLPFTGQNTSTELAVALSAILTGSALLRPGRRRTVARDRNRVTPVPCSADTPADRCHQKALATREEPGQRHIGTLGHEVSR